MARTNYYKEKLKDLTGFDGFFQRLFIPASRMYKKDSESGEYTYATQTLFWIDSANEIKVDVGLDFPTVKLGTGEIQVPKEIA